MKLRPFYLFFIFILGLTACSNRVESVSSSEMKESLAQECDRYNVYFDSCISALKIKTDKDSSRLYIGGLFKNRIENDPTSNQIMQYKRWDAYIIKKVKDAPYQLKDFHSNYKVQDAATKSCEYDKGFTVLQSPFLWNNVQLDLMSKDKIAMLPIERWAFRWLGTDDIENSKTKTNVIHSINIMALKDTMQLNIDLGTVNKQAFFDLLDSIKSSGATFVHIKS